jgi:HK97 family phage major capsid protein
MTISTFGNTSNLDAAEADRQRQIMRLATANNVREFGEKHIIASTALASFRGMLNIQVRETQGRKLVDAAPGEIGLSEKEAKAWSLSRMVAAQLDPNYRREAGFEMETCAAARDNLNAAGIDSRPGEGFTIPQEVVERKFMPWQSRALLAGSGTGANLVQTTVLDNAYIAPNYAVPQVIRAGATVLPNLVGNIKVPKMTAGTTAAWISTENTAPSVSDPTFAQLSLSPHDCGAFIDVSRRLMLQSNPGIDGLIEQDLQTQLMLALDTAALVGTGASGQPLGLSGLSIGSAPGGTNGAALSWANVILNIQNVAAANRLIGDKLGWITSPVGKGHAMRTVRVASYPSFIIDAPFDNLAGYPVYVSGDVPTNLTKGTGTSLTEFFFGNWADMLIGIWGHGLDVLIDPYTFSSSGAIRIRVLMTADVQVRFAASFSATNDVNPT